MVTCFLTCLKHLILSLLCENVEGLNWGLLLTRVNLNFFSATELVVIIDIEYFNSIKALDLIGESLVYLLHLAMASKQTCFLIEHKYGYVPQWKKHPLLFIPSTTHLFLLYCYLIMFQFTIMCVSLLFLNL